MSLPTHRVIATGERVFPGGHDPGDLELLPAGYWADIAFEEARDTKRAAIDAARDAHFALGFAPAIGGLSGHRLQVRDADDRTNWLTSQAAYSAAVASGAGAVSGATFRTMDNQTVSATYAEGLATLLAMAAWGGAVFANSWALKDAASAATTQAELDAIDPNTGWP